MDGTSLTPEQEKLNALRQVLPEVFSEGKIDWEKLKATLGADINFANERYVLNWAGKSEAFKVLQMPTTKTLIPAKDESVNFDETENIFIEGENLEVLKVLQKSCFGKVKMIYIDPPYNTGNDSFIYPDKFSESKADYEKRVGDKDEEGNKTSDSFKKNSKENGQYHSNWLNMMMPRLYLAKNLLRQDGVIFVSIDDNEVHNLRLLMNEIFGEENFINEFIWRSGRTSGAIYTKEHEYILAFSKNIELLDLIQYNGVDEIISDRAIKKIGVKNPASEIAFPKGMRFESENKIFPIEFGASEVITVVEGELKCENKLLANDVILKAGWVMKDMIEDWIDGKEVYDSKGQKVTEFFFKDNGVLQYVKEKGTIHPKTIIEDYSTKSGTNEVIKLMQFKAFDYPKPIGLINFLQQISEKDSIILDFFAGSGSTAQAVMDLNKEDISNRKFICVQMPELTIEKSEAYKTGYTTIAEISKERIRRAGKKIQKEIKTEIKKIETEITKLQGELPTEENKTEIGNLKTKIEQLKAQDLGFKVLKLADSNFKQWQQIEGKDAKALAEQMKLFVDPVSESATIENMVYELLLKSGKDLNSPIKKKDSFYKINNNELILLLEKATQEIIDLVIAEKPIKVVALDKLFKGNDQLKTNTVLQMKDAGIEFKTI
jgi:adenine-specific DNA-methyltransferase